MKNIRKKFNAKDLKLFKHTRTICDSLSPWFKSNAIKNLISNLFTIVNIKQKIGWI